jgi:cytochrome-b5 reductase
MALLLALSDFINLSDPTVIGGLIVGAITIFAVGRFLFASDSAQPAKKADNVVGKGKEVSKDVPAARPAPVRTGVLDPSKFQKFALKERIELNHNTRLYRFALPNETDVLGLPIGQHMSFRAVIDGKEVYRPYTPTSSDDDLGHFDLVIKVYPQGKMSQYIDNMKVGELIDVKGPKGLFTYTPNMKRAFGMLAGGTGITPMLQVIQAILKNPADRTQVSLIFANVAEDDILVRSTLEDLAAKNPDRFKLHYTLDKPPADWKYSQGFITADMVAEHCLAPADDVMILMCGPTPMVNAQIGNLQKLGYSENQYFKF